MSISKTNITLSAVALLIMMWAVGYVCFSLTALFPPPPQDNKKVEAIIVLTGGNYRVKTGMDAFMLRTAPRLFISGVHPDVSIQNIYAMWEGDYPLPPCCISIGQEATTTIENAQEVKNWINDHGYKSIHLVTSGYHMPRALVEFRRALPEIEITPHPVPYKDYKARDLHFWVITFSEYHKWMFRMAALSLSPKQGTLP